MCGEDLACRLSWLTIGALIIRIEFWVSFGQIMLKLE